MRGREARAGIRRAYRTIFHPHARTFTAHVATLMGRPFMSPAAMQRRRKLAVHLRREEKLSYRQIGELLGCSHTAARLFVEAPDAPLRWDRKGTQGRVWDAGDAQDRRATRRRRAAEAQGMVWSEEDDDIPPIDVQHLYDLPMETGSWIPHPLGGDRPAKQLEWATKEKRQRVDAYVDADPRRRCSTEALMAHCRLFSEGNDDTIRDDFDALLRVWGFMRRHDGGWSRPPVPGSSQSA